MGLQCVERRPEISNRVSGPGACEVKPHSKPWIVNLLIGCGGTLIGRKYVITAAHCMIRCSSRTLKCIVKGACRKNEIRCCKGIQHLPSKMIDTFNLGCSPRRYFTFLLFLRTLCSKCPASSLLLRGFCSEHSVSN